MTAFGKDPMASGIQRRTHSSTAHLPTLRSLLGCLLLITAGIAGSYGWLVPGADARTLLGAGDSHWYFGPQSLYLDWAISRGEFPLWSPLQFCGQPFAANPQSGACYPPNLLRSLLTAAFSSDTTALGTHAGLLALAVFHLFVAGLGTFTFARELGLSRGAALVSTWAFVFSASFVRRVVAHQFLGVVAWLPWILLGLRRAGRADTSTSRRRRNLVGATFAFGLGTLGGFPQLSIYMGAGLAVYVFATRALEGEASPAGFGSDTGRLSLLALGAGLLAAPMLLPAIDFIQRSARVDPGLVPLAELTRVNDFPGWRNLGAALTRYPGPSGLDLNYRGVGACALILAFCAVLHPARRRTGALFVLFFALADCSIGPPAPLAFLLSKLSPAALISPSRGFILALPPLALLAGFGADALGRQGGGWGGRSDGRSGGRWLAVPVLLGVAGVMALLALGAGVEDSAPPLLALALPGALALWVLASLLRAPKEADAGSGLFLRTLLPLALVGCETSAWNRDFVPAILEQRGYTGAIDRLREPSALPRDNRRMTLLEGDDTLYRLRPVSNGYDPLYLAQTYRVLTRPALEGTYNRSVHRRDVATFNQRGNLLFKRPFWLARRVVREVLPAKQALYPAATTAFLQTGAALAVEERSGSTGLASVAGSLERPTPLQRLTGTEPITWQRRPARGRLVALTPEVELPALQGAIWVDYRAASPAQVEVTLVSEEGAEPLYGIAAEPTGKGVARVEVPLPDSPRGRLRFAVEDDQTPPELLAVSVAEDRADEGELITIRSWGANGVELDVGPLSGPRILTFTDAAHPGWTARVDGEPVEIYPAAEAFKGIELAPGTHRVEFRFESPRLIAGLWLCGLALGAGALVIAAGARRPSWV